MCRIGLERAWALGLHTCNFAILLWCSRSAHDFWWLAHVQAAMDGIDIIKLTVQLGVSVRMFHWCVNVSALTKNSDCKHLQICAIIFHVHTYRTLWISWNTGYRSYLEPLCLTCTLIFTLLSFHPGVSTFAQMACTLSWRGLGASAVPVCRHSCQNVGCQMPGRTKVIRH